MQEHKSHVFLVATANDIEALPPELLRKGRFDEIFFVDLPTEGVREVIFRIHLRKRGYEPDLFDVAKLADMSRGFSGAEIEQAYDEKRIGKVPHDPALPVTTYWDLGLDDATAVLFVQTLGKEVRIIEAEEWNQTALTQVAADVLAKPYIYADHVFPHDVRVREMTTGRSREEVLKRLLGKLSVAPMLSVDDGINALRTMFTRIWIDEAKSSKFLEAAKNYRKKWDDKRKVFENRPWHDWSSHMADAGRMLAVSYKERIDRGQSDRYGKRKPVKRSAWAA
jgi:hypothetical protein